MPARFSPGPSPVAGAQPIRSADTTVTGVCPPQAIFKDVDSQVPAPLAAPFNSLNTHNSDRSLHASIFSTPVSPESFALTTAPPAALMGPAFGVASTLPVFPASKAASDLSPEPPKGREMIDMETGEVWYATKESSGRYRTIRKLDGLIEYAGNNNLKYYFATTTFAPSLGLTMLERDAYRTKFLHKLRKKFRKAGLEIKYCWVFSLQLERFLAGDDAATPYHILIACAPGSLPDQQPVTDAKGKDRWRTVSEGTLLTLNRLKSMWTTPDGRRLGTVNCGMVRSLPAARAYMLQNEQEAEQHRVGKHRRFGGSRLGLLGAAKGLRRKVNEELKAHPELGYNSFVRRNGTVLMRVVRDGRVVHEKAIVSSWTSDPEGWLERKRDREEAALKRQQLQQSVPTLSSEAVVPARISALPLPAGVSSPLRSRTDVMRLDIPSVPTSSVACASAMEPVAEVLDAIMDRDLRHARVLRPVRPGIWHDLRRVRPAIGFMSGSMSGFKDEFGCTLNSGFQRDPFTAHASLTPRPDNSGDAFPGTFHGASRGEYHAPDSTIPPADTPASSPSSSPAPARSHARCASEHDTHTDSPAERAFDPAQGDTGARLAGYMRRLGLHEAPGDAGTGTPDMSRENVSITNMLRDMSAPGVDAQAVAPAKYAWVLPHGNLEVRS